MAEPPSAPPPGSAGPPARAWQGAVIELEGGGGWRKRLKRGDHRLTITAAEIVIEHAGDLREPLTVAPGAIAAAALDPGSAAGDRNKAIGRFPILRRLSPTAVVPREEGIEGWLWTSTGGSAFTHLGDEDVAPNLALVFLQPLEAEYVARVFEPDVLEELAKRSPLGSPTVFGVLLRVEQVERARTALNRIGVVKPLTDREVPPTQRRHLPTDKPANPHVGGGGDGGRAKTSVPPPGMG